MADGKVEHNSYEVKPHILERFPVASRSIWKDVSDKDWNSWIWQQQNRVKNLEQLGKVINLTDEERKKGMPMQTAVPWQDLTSTDGATPTEDTASPYSP